jgi:hypothetical protein
MASFIEAGDAIDKETAAINRRYDQILDGIFTRTDPQTIDVALAVKPEHVDEWISIDPTSPTGRAFIERLGFTTTPSKEDTMSAVAIEQQTTPRHLRVVENNREQMSLLLRARATARKAYDKMLSLPKAAWTWMKQTLHLDPALGFVADGFRWVRAKATAVTQYLGVPGLTGAGLLAISTGTGRAILGAALQPVAWTARLIGRGYLWLENALSVEEDDKGRFAGIRRFISTRMADARQYVTGDGRSDGGLVGKAAGFIAKWVYPTFQIDSLPMQGARTAGTAILGMQLLPLVALIPLGGFAIAGQYLATAGVVGLSAFNGWGFLTKAAAWVKARFTKAEEIATGEATPGADVVDIVATAADAGVVIGHGASTEPRAVRRAQKRAEAKQAQKR